MKVVGVTGGFGTGKTYVASLLQELGARVVDADAIAHSVLARNQDVRKRIAAHFGERVLGPTGRVDRRKLAGVVFADRTKLKTLNRIVHPAVTREMRRMVGSGKGDGMIVVDAPLLIEARLGGIVDTLVVVTASRKRQIERCVRKFGITAGEVGRRIGSQMPLAKKKRIADFVIDNDGRKSKTREQVRKLWSAISRKM